MWKTILMWTVAVVLLPSPPMVNASGVFELRLKSFVNEYGKDSTGECCSGSKSKTGECTGVCKTKFRVCLKQYQAQIDTTSTCTYGVVVTPVLGGNVVNLSPDIALPSFTNPIKFAFNFSWPGTFSLIVEAYHEVENITGHSPEDVLIRRYMDQRWLDVATDWTSAEYADGGARVTFAFRVTCQSHNYGKGCEKICNPRDDIFGHYSCSPTGERVCLYGWKGDYCATPRCLPGCDEQHGHCTAPNECKCNKGWTGAFCDQCMRYPGCLHGTCQKPWECLCNEGWGGLFCNQDLNYCTNHKPCLNGGTCFNTGQGSYTCSCAPGFNGTDCEKPLKDCQSKPCLNGGGCSMINNNTQIIHQQRRITTRSYTNTNNTSDVALRPIAYRCTCPPGWSGRHCEISSRSCRDSPCLHGATCIDDSLKGYTCHCPSGYTGGDCEAQINECAPNPCLNNGTCSDIINGYRCSCPTGFTGERCEIDINECKSDPCLNGGTCIDKVGEYRCHCIPGFTGSVCQDKVDYCRAKPCANGGKCISGTNDYRCICKPGFTNKDCSIEVDECKSAPCQNGGICTNRVNEFLCECKKGWRGGTCSEPDNGLTGGHSGTSVNNGVLPSGASYWSGNLSRPSAEARDAGLTTEHVVVIATLSTAVPAFVLVAALAVMCMKRRQKREQARADEEARLQNERNAVHSSLSKRSGSTGCNAGGGGGVGGGGSNANGVSMVGPGGVFQSGAGCSNGLGVTGSGVCSLGNGDSHMIKNTWTANKSVNNSTITRDDLDSSFHTDSGLDISCSGYKPEQIITDCRSRTPKQLNTEAAAHRASHHFQKEKDICSSVGVIDAKRTSMFSSNTLDSCCANSDSSLLKRPTLTDTGGGGGGCGTDGSCGVYVIDDHYRHDAALAATLATEV